MFKRLFVFLTVALLSVVSCSKFDDSKIWDKLNEHEDRISKLETLCKQMNTNIASLQSIISALQNNEYITNVAPIIEGGEEKGYTITFSSGKSVTIYHGKNGKDGADGEDGKDGQDGKDGTTPVVGVKQDADGKYYWTLNGEWLLDPNGNKIPTTGADGADGKDGADGEDGKDGEDGEDGSDGKDGQDGKDGTTPVIGVKRDSDGRYYWTLNGEWLLDANGNKIPTTGQDGADGENGEDGADGVDGDSMFSSVDTSNPDYVVITLSNGTVIKLPTWRAFEALQALVNQINTNVSALQSIVEALQNNDYVTSVVPVREGGKVVGYTITFSKSGAVTIYHGKDGTNGTDGVDGQPGNTPVIGVKQDTDGKYYWTVNGEWLKDSNGNKIPTTGADGTNGEDGEDGEDGVDGQPGSTPVIGVKQDTDGKYYWTVNGEWLLDADGNKIPTTGQDGANGEDGEDGADGKDGVDGDSMFSSVDTSNPDYVVITLSNGTVIKLPTWRAFEALQALVNQINTNVNALQAIVEALQNNDYVTSVVPVREGGKVVGYTITFSKSGAVTIYHGKDGTNGTDGVDGQPGNTPVIGVKQDTDGKYYWTVNGEWLKDSNGNKIPTTGSDGASGEDGVDGQPGSTPVIGVKQDTDGKYYWTVNGEWLLDANSNKVPTAGNDGADGEDGSDGKDGVDGDSMFSSVDTSNPDYVVITLSNGTVIKLPTWRAFEALQALVNQINTNVNALQAIVEALQNNDYVTSVVPVREGGKVVGYTITFSKSGAVTIYHGKDGTNGTDGVDGQPGNTPVIGVKQDTDGKYYWTVNGEWLKDSNGNKIPTTGSDGANGEDGEDGVDGQPGSTPVIGVKQDTDGKYYWTVNGEWLLDANGNKIPTAGKDGADGEDGADGKDGVDGDSMFSSVDTSNPDYVIITLSNSTVIKLPTWRAFEALQALVNQINTNVNALQAIVEALQNNDYVTSVVPVREGGKEVGYTITFSKSGAVTIYHGKDGTNGTDGVDGQPGNTPVIGVKQDTDGKYYWTVNGEWLKDSNGNKIPTTGADGANGITPQLRIENDRWQISLDNGVLWTDLGGSRGDSFFKSVTQYEQYISLVLADGTEILLPKYPNAAIALTLQEVTGFTATFEGRVIKKSLDLKVTVYYSKKSDLTVYKNAGSVAVTSFDGDTFILKLTGLDANTKYYYFSEVICEGNSFFSEVSSFDTKGPDSYVDWDEGEVVEGEI